MSDFFRHSRRNIFVLLFFYRLLFICFGIFKIEDKNSDFPRISLLFGFFLLFLQLKWKIWKL